MMAQDRAEVFGGVDTHKQTHVAAAVDAAGGLLGTAAFAADADGYSALLGWLESFGALGRVGVEGTGSYGAGLARHLAAAGVEVVEVNRPNRQMRRRRGKTDAVDAEAAARAVLCGEATAAPKSADGCVEAVRTLTVARRSAVKAHTVAANQIDALVVTAPERLQCQLRARPKAGLINTCARLRPDPARGPVDAAAKLALRALARRHQALSTEIDTLDTELRRLCEAANPALLGACGVGAATAATLLIAAGDNPHRMRSEASFASLCGTNPVEASSGPQVRHRLNRGGNRQANNALWRIAMVRLRVDQRTIDYAARRSTEGNTRREILRCIKRHITREIYRLLTDPPEVPQRANLRQHRLQAGITLTAAAHALDVAPARISTLETGRSHNNLSIPPAPTLRQQHDQPQRPREGPSRLNQHSKIRGEAQPTSPSATTTGSPNSRLDKHRSINLVKRVKRAAFGFTNFANYRIRALLYADKPNRALLDTLTPP